MESVGTIGNGLVYAAALLLIGAFAMSAIRPMRLLASGAVIALLAHLALVGAPPAAIGLALVFLFVNSVQLFGMLRRSREGAMREEERALFDHLLGPASARHEGRLRDLIHWSVAAEGDVLIRQDETDPPLIYVASGRVSVEADGVEVGTCGEGDFLGEMSLVSGHTASATVTVVAPARIARFDRDALAQYAHAVPEVGTAITNALNRGLAAKVERMNEAATRSRQ